MVWQIAWFCPQCVELACHSCVVSLHLAHGVLDLATARADAVRRVRHMADEVRLQRPAAEHHAAALRTTAADVIRQEQDMEQQLEQTGDLAHKMITEWVASRKEALGRRIRQHVAILQDTVSGIVMTLDHLDVLQRSIQDYLGSDVSAIELLQCLPLLEHAVAWHTDAPRRLTRPVPVQVTLVGRLEEHLPSALRQVCCATFSGKPLDAPQPAGCVQAVSACKVRCV